MSLWLLLAAHLIADFSLQSADWAEKKTREFRYLAGHAVVYAAVIAVVAFTCIPGNVVWIPFTIIALSHFAIDWIRVRSDAKCKTPTAHFSSFVIDQVLHIGIIYVSVCAFGLNGQTRSWLTDLEVKLLFCAVSSRYSVPPKRCSSGSGSSPSSVMSKEE